jgi:hypothetical protein
MAIFAGKILKTIFLRQKEAPSPMTGAILEQSEPSYQPFTGTAVVRVVTVSNTS